MAPRFQVKQSITFEEVLGESKRRLGDIARARTLTGSMAAVTRYADLFRKLVRESPFVARFIADDVKSMDVSGLPEMEKMKESLVTEILARGDAGDRSYYTAPTVGQPFKTRVRAAQPVLDKFFFVATRASRKNALRGVLRG